MSTLKNKYRSVYLTRLYMKVLGCWKASSDFEQRIMDIALIYAILAILFAIVVEGIDLYYCFGDFYAATENLCASMLLVMIIVKFSSFVYYRDVVMHIIQYAETNFWEVEYDDYGEMIMQDCDKKAVMLTYLFTGIVQCAALCYIIAPILENPTFDVDQRQLPFTLWFNWPVLETPFYEILFTIESLSTIHSGICTFGFDNFLSCFNVHVAGQFKILAHKFETIADSCVNEMTKMNDETKVAKLACDTFKNCVREHRKLIEYVERMEEAFTWILLGQLVLSSMAICFGCFTFLAGLTMKYYSMTESIFIVVYNNQVTESIPKKCIYTFFFCGSLSQLYLYTWTCNDITYQSDRLSTSVYNMAWYSLPHTASGKIIKHGIVMVINRTRHPCVLTAGKFAAMSLETFSNILGTALSYLTLLQQMSEDE